MWEEERADSVRHRCRTWHTGGNARGTQLRESRRKMKCGKAAVKISTNILISKLNQCMKYTNKASEVSKT